MSSGLRNMTPLQMMMTELAADGYQPVRQLILNILQVREPRKMPQLR